MLKFFRRIRQKLIHEGNLKKYLIYAIGEILLVVIGILIALQINNWNEENKQNSRSVLYHQRIYEDLNQLITGSENLTNRAGLILKSVTKTTELLESGQLKTEEDKETVEYALIWFSRTSYKLPELPTYEEMKSNGDLNLIYNIELRNEIANFNNLLQQVETIVEKLSNAIEFDFRIYNKYIRTYVDPESLEVMNKYDFNKMAADEEFINTFSRLSFHWRGYVYFMQAITVDAEKLLAKFKIQLDAIQD